MDFDQNSPIQYEWTLKTPTALQSMAMNAVVCDLWRRVLIISRQNGTLRSVLEGYATYNISCHFQSKKIEISFINLNNADKNFLEHFSVSSNISLSLEIEVILQRRFRALQLNSREWYFYHFNLLHIFYKSKFTDVTYIYRNFLNLKFDGNDNIDYVATAREMVKCENFINAVRYLFACIYCFESDIERLWPPVLCDEVEMENWIFSIDLCLLTLWTFRMRNRDAFELLQPMQWFLDNSSAIAWYFNFEQAPESSVISRSKVWRIFSDILEGNAVPNYPPWNYISFLEEDPLFQLTKLKVKLLTLVIRFGFSEMDDEFFKKTVGEVGYLIMIWFMNVEDLWQFAMPFWLKIRHMITALDFAVMFETYYYRYSWGKKAFDVHPQKLLQEYQSVAITDEFLEETAKRIRLDVWQSAPKELTEFALNHFGKYHALHTLNFL